jgi:elongation factor P
MYSIGELRPGMVIIVDGDPYVIAAAQHSKQARQGGVCKTKIKNLLTGSMVNKSFQGNDKLEPADVTYGKAQFLYSDGEAFNFMDNESFEQFALDNETIGDQANYLVDGTDVDIQYFEGKPISVMIPPKMDLEVTHTDPGVKGDTASGGSKPATLETGYVLQVPLFINIGEKIRVNTQSGEYVERAN